MQLRPSSIAVGGDAVAREDGGRVVFVTGALPGELVEVVLTEERKDFARATVVEVLEPSAARVGPPCVEVANGCGGCDWQHIDPSAQRSFKADVVRTALARQGRIVDPVVDEGPALPTAAFRTTLRLGGGPSGLGFRRRQSHDVLTVGGCHVAHPLLAELLGQVTFDSKREVTLRCGARTGDRLVLVEPTADGTEVPDGVVLVGADELAAGRRVWFHEVVAGVRLRISARSFFQASPEGAEALVEAVAAAAEGAPDGRMIDAYGGVGLFAATVGKDRPVTVLEQSPSACADARVNLPDGRVLVVDVDRWHASRAALVVADPSRAGLGRRGVNALSATAATHLVLVSCDPASLGRDAALLVAAGFRHDGSTLVDVFPHTHHVEVVSRFIRSAAPLRTGRA